MARKWRGWDSVGRFIIVALVMQAFLVSFSISAITPIFESPFALNRVYMANLIQSAQQVPASRSLIPQFAPNAVVPVAAPGPTSTELVLASQATSPTFTDAVAGELWGFTEDGRLVKQAVFGVEASGKPGEQCVALISGEATTVRLKRQSEYPFATLSLGSIVQDAAQLRVEILDGGEVKGSVDLSILPGLQRTYSILPGQGDSLRLTPVDDQPICVTDAVVGERFHWDARWVQDGSSLPIQSFDLSRP